MINPNEMFVMHFSTSHTLTVHSYSTLSTNLESTINLTHAFLLEYPAGKGGTCEPHTERPQLGFEPGTFLPCFLTTPPPYYSSCFCVKALSDLVMTFVLMCTTYDHSYTVLLFPKI